MDIDLGERVVRVDDGFRFYKSLTRLQAVIRGARVRKNLLATRQQFEVLFNDVEERTLLELTWPRDLLCAPVLRYPSCSRSSKRHSVNNTTQSHLVKGERQLDDGQSGLNGVCSCCGVYHVAPHEHGESRCVDGVTSASATVSEENCSIQDNCLTNTAISDLPSINTNNKQSKRTHSTCEADDRSVNVSPTSITQSDARTHPRDSEQPSGPQQGNVRTDQQPDVATVDVVCGDKPTHDISPCRHKNTLVAQEGSNGRETLSAGHARDDSVTRNASSVWDSVDGSPFRESRDSLEGEDRAYLEEKKGNITMELLWIQQAIESRKQYLRLKTRMAQTVS